VLSCAGAYVWGAAGSNACPAGSVRIETEAACRAAVAAAGKTPASPFLATTSNWPRGCNYEAFDDNSYFNNHAVGAGYTSAVPLCAVATFGAPHRCTSNRVLSNRWSKSGVAQLGAHGYDTDS
jgi:hypothetical protein